MRKSKLRQTQFLYRKRLEALFMPKIGRIVERYISNPTSTNSKKTNTSVSKKAVEPDTESSTLNPKPIDYSTLQTPTTWNGKPTLMETARRIGFFNTTLPVGLTLQGGNTMYSADEAQKHLLQLQRSFLA